MAKFIPYQYQLLFLGVKRVKIKNTLLLFALLKSNVGFNFRD